MPSKRQPKIIKRAETGDSKQIGLPEKPTGLRNDRKTTKRDAVTIVTEWVTEWRREKAQEAALGFKTLFRSST